MTKAAEHPTTSARWPAPVRSTDNPEPVPPIWDPTRQPPPPPSGRRRVLAGAAAAVLGGTLASCIPLPAPTAEAEPDAELIALCARHIANMNTYNRDGGYLELEDDPLWHAYEQTMIAISDAKPQTIRGVLAKAHAAKAEGTGLGGSEDFENCPAVRWGWDVVNDLIRLNAGGHA